MIDEPTMSCVTNEYQYCEPSEEEVKALFDNIPLKEGFEDLSPGVFVYPISLQQYEEHFVSDTADYSNEAYLTWMDPVHNYINWNSGWSEKTSGEFEDCLLQQEVDYMVEGFFLYPNMHQKATAAVCEYTDTYHWYVAKTETFDIPLV